MLTHTNIRRLGLVASIAAVFFLLPFDALAQGNSFAQQAQSGFASVITSINAALNLMTWIIFLFLNILLDPGFMFGQMGGENPATFVNILNKLWIFSRDTMNIIFAFMLIGAAVYTIVTAKKGFAAEHLKTFVLCVVLVNFSWFVPRVVLDIANITASVVYSLPSLVASSEAANACTLKSKVDMTKYGLTLLNPADQNGYKTFRCAVITNARFFLDSKEAQTLSEQAPTAWYCPLGSVFCVQMQDLDINATANHSTILNGLIVNHGRLQGLSIVTPPKQGQSDNAALIYFILQQMIVLAIHVALFFPLAAMAMAFAIRIPVLWMTMAFMPFTFLKFLVPGDMAGMAEDIWKYFVKAAFLPAIVAVPLSVGFILVNTGASMIALNAQNVAQGNIAFDVGSIHNFYELLWLGMTLAVLWGGVFMALKKVGGIFETGASFFESMGKSLGGIALKAPLSLPILPGPSGKLSLSPLQFLKSVDPRVINRSLDNGASIIDAAKGIGKPPVTGPNAREFGDAAKRLDKDTVLFEQTNDILKKIEDELKKPNGGDADRLARVEIGGKLNLSSVGKDNIETVLQNLRTEIASNIAESRHKDNMLRDIDQRIISIKEAKKPAAAAPPAP